MSEGVIGSNEVKTRIDAGHPKVLFVTRKTDPNKGGMQRASCALLREFSERIPIEIIPLPDSKIAFLLSLPSAFIRGLRMARISDIVYLQDGVLSVLGILWKSMGHKVSVTVHGLEITYPNFFYQKLVPPTVTRFDGVICVSSATRDQCVSRGVDPRRIRVIGNGVDLKPGVPKDRITAMKEVESRFRIPVSGRTIILSVGRPVERKGFHWFIEEVIPILIANGHKVNYIVVGNGPFSERLAQAREQLTGDNDSVSILGHVEDEDLETLYAIADIFVMPNLPVKGDIEGFGIVGLEAALSGLPIVANGIEGMRDYLRDGENSLLMTEIEPSGFAEKVERLIADPKLRRKLGDRLREEALTERSWGIIAEQYIEFFEELLGDGGE
jgi:phosphatidylinositol alpha-1,6-mannosyltransferase